MNSNENQIFHPGMGISVNSEWIGMSEVKVNHSPLLRKNCRGGVEESRLEEPKGLRGNYIQRGEGKGNIIFLGLTGIVNPLLREEKGLGGEKKSPLVWFDEGEKNSRVDTDGVPKGEGARYDSMSKFIDSHAVSDGDYESVDRNQFAANKGDWRPS
jgi:hypothetical protein